MFRRWSTPSEPTGAEISSNPASKCLRLTFFDEETADTEEDDETISDHENDLVQSKPQNPRL